MSIGTRNESVPGTERVAAFSDGVFAVVATLLVLDLHVPAIPAHPTTVALAHAFRPVLFNLLTFGLSFFFVVIVWVNHHQIFHSLAVADRGLLWANNLLLFWMCLLPFPTALLGAYPQLPLAAMALSGSLFAASIAFLLIVRHAEKAELYESHVDTITRRTIMRRGWFGPPAFFCCVILGAFSPPLSTAAMLAVMFFFAVPTRIVSTEDPR